MEVFTDLEMKEFESLISANEMNEIQIQFTRKPGHLYCKLIIEYISDKNITLRFYSYKQEFKDLSLLKWFSNLEKIILDGHFNQ